MSSPSRKCRKDSEIRLAFARSEYRSVRAGSPENRTALVTSSETSSSAVSTVPSLIPWQESRNERVYRRAQNGEVGNVTQAIMPGSSCGGGVHRSSIDARHGLSRHRGLPPDRAYLTWISCCWDSGASPKDSALLAACSDLRRCRHRLPSPTGSLNYGSV